MDIGKLGRSFFDGSGDNDRSRAMLEGMMYTANRLKVRVSAEGVETQQDVEFLRSVKCHMVQGYYFSRPQPADDFFA